MAESYVEISIWSGTSLLASRCIAAYTNRSCRGARAKYLCNVAEIVFESRIT